MSENTTLELKPTQCAIVLDEDWDLSIHIAQTDEDDDTPLNVRYMTMLAILTNDDDFVEDILDKFYVIARDIMEEDEEAN